MVAIPRTWQYLDDRIDREKVDASANAERVARESNVAMAVDDILRWRLHANFVELHIARSRLD